MRRSRPDCGLQLSGRSPRGGHGVGRPGPPIHFAAQPGAAGTAGHTLIVMLENHSYSQVIGGSSAPSLNELARRGALFTGSRVITHHQPNYLALFSGNQTPTIFENLYHPRPRA